MKQLSDFKKDLRKCSKCGLCQAECPIYKITGNDCSVSRGQLIMLQAVLNGELKLSKKINRYLDLCLKCGACSKFCPSGVEFVDIIIAAKAEYLKLHPIEKIKTFFQKKIVFGLIPNLIKKIRRSTKSKSFSKKVLYFGGCGAKIKGSNSIIKLLNAVDVEVVLPNFGCCGISYFVRGDLEEFNNSIKSYISILKEYDIKEVVTVCASCEKSLKDYIKWADDEDKEFLKSVRVKNIYVYLKEADVKLELKKRVKVTYHKPCNITNWEDISWLLNNIDNLEYIEMQDFDKCCGLNGISKFGVYKILSKVFESKRLNIKNTRAKIVTTSCLGCEIALKTYSFGKYRTLDLIDFIGQNL